MKGWWFGLERRLGRSFEAVGRLSGATINDLLESRGNIWIHYKENGALKGSLDGQILT